MTARDLRLDPTTGDLDLSGGSLSLVSGTDAIAQAIRIRLTFFLGEWFLDTDAGVKYFGSVLVKNPQIPVIKALFRTEILNTPGVASLVSLDLEYSPGSRALAVAFRVLTDTGELLVGSV
jgi:hypothetical protein